MNKLMKIMTEEFGWDPIYAKKVLASVLEDYNAEHLDTLEPDELIEIVEDYADITEDDDDDEEDSDE
ncbi:MAG TPA: hypothetical protein VIJ93_00585 [bacterium]